MSGCGNFVDENEHVVERFTMTGPDRIVYEATVTDPTVYSGPWTSDQTWLDAAGHHHSDQLHVVERYTRTSPRTIAYEATIDDPQVFTMPWKIHLTLRQQSGAELIEDECDVDSKDVRHHVLPFKK